MDVLTLERLGQPSPPPAPRRVVNRWGDTADDQRRRRDALVRAMREVPDEPA